MTQAQVADLLGPDQSVVSRHAANTLEEDELDEESNVQKVHSAHSARPVTIYSLDMLISVGYGVSSAQATSGRLVTMQAARDLLDGQLKSLGRMVLDGGGKISADKAKAKAEGEYTKWDALRKAERHRLADEGIAKLLAEAKALPHARK